MLQTNKMPGKRFEEYSYRQKQRILNKQVEKDLEDMSTAEMEDLEMEVEIETEVDAMAVEYGLTQPQNMDNTHDGTCDISKK